MDGDAPKLASAASLMQDLRSFGRLPKRAAGTSEVGSIYIFIYLFIYVFIYLSIYLARPDQPGGVRAQGIYPFMVRSMYLST